MNLAEIEAVNFLSYKVVYILDPCYILFLFAVAIIVIKIYIMNLY